MVVGNLHVTFALFHWNDTCIDAFLKLKDAIMEATALSLKNEEDLYIGARAKP
jgi:hypothetical protein